MKKNIVIVCISAIILALIIVLPFCFKNDELRLSDKIFALYITNKIVFGLIFVFSVAWCVIKERAKGFVYITLVMACLLQGIPALCRLAPRMKDFGMGFEIIMLALGLIIFIGVFAMIAWSSKKQLVSDEKYVGKEIPVQEEKVILNKEDK